MRLASLAMYASPPPLAEATAALWRFLSDALKRAGLDDIPGCLDTAVRYNEAWTHPGLLLAQTCGFPYVKLLRGKVRLVATPIYGHPGCDGPSNAASSLSARVRMPVRWRTWLAREPQSMSPSAIPASICFARQLRRWPGTGGSFPR